MIRKLALTLACVLGAVAFLFFFVLFAVAFPFFYLTTACSLCITISRLTYAKLFGRPEVECFPEHLLQSAPQLMTTANNETDLLPDSEISRRY